MHTPSRSAVRGAPCGIQRGSRVQVLAAARAELAPPRERAPGGRGRKRAPNPAALVRALVSAAYERSRDKRARTPYSVAASEWFDQIYDGGKPDDITAVVAFIE